MLMRNMFYNIFSTFNWPEMFRHVKSVNSLRLGIMEEVSRESRLTDFCGSLQKNWVSDYAEFQEQILHIHAAVHLDDLAGNVA